MKILPDINKSNHHGFITCKNTQVTESINEYSKQV